MGKRTFDYFEGEEDTEELICSSNEECLEISPNKPICRENNCQPECTPLAPCLIGQSCIDGRCNIESDVQKQHVCRQVRLCTSGSLHKSGTVKTQ